MDTGRAWPNRTGLSAALLLLVLVLAGGAAAQGRSTVTTEDNITIYHADYFADFNAITAEDLLKRVPGIQDLLPQSNTGPGFTTTVVEQRGFGTNEEVFLFNGRRLSGKANDAAAALKRIQARQVARIEVIRGAVPGLDVKIGPQGVLVNLVLIEDLSTGVGSWEASGTFWSSGRSRPGGSVSYSGTSGALSYNVSATVDPTMTRRVTYDDYYRTFESPGQSSAQPFAKLYLIDQNVVEARSLTGNLSYAFANGDVGNLNARVSNDRRVLLQPADDFSVTPAGTVIYTGSRLQERADHKKDNELELGGDYEHALSSDSKLRGLFVLSYDRRYNEALFYGIPIGAARRFDREQISDPTRTEKIVRVTYDKAFSATQSLEAGAEVALNALDQTNRRFDVVGGVPREVALFNASTKVKEKRLETFANYSWKFTPRFSMIGALDTEYSRLNQSGRDVNSSRTFFFLKPRLDARYDIGAGSQVSARVFRSISQLDFGNFVSTFVTDDNRLNQLLAGNPNLVPEKTWTAEATYGLRFANRSNVSLRAFYNRIDDAIDKIRVLPGVSGTGNIGEAKSYGVELRSGIRLDWLGLERASVDITGTLQDSSVVDAFVPQTRQLKDFRSYLWSVSYRQDLDWQGFSYGATVVGEDDYPGTDIDYVQLFKVRQGEMNAFAEVKPGEGKLTFRVEASRLLDRGVFRLRYQYSGDRATAPLSRTEFRDDKFARSLKLIVKGAF